MVYESDFYTTRRPYRPSPSLSTYTVSSLPSRQVRVLPGLGKVHIVHTYDRIVPYVGHKRLTVVTTPPKVFSTRPSVLNREYDRIENKLRPWNAYSATNRYLNSDSAVKIVINRPFTAEVDIKQKNKGKIYRSVNLHYDHYWPLKDLNTYSDEWPNYDSLPCKSQYPSEHFYFVKGIFDDETRLIRAQTASLLKRVHSPVPRLQRSWPLTTILRYDEGLPARLSNDHYIHKLLTTSPKNPRVSYTTYYTEPVKKYIGQGRLSCISYAGDKAFSRRRAATRSFLYEDPLRNDIQLLSFYINKFRDEKKAIQASGGSSAKVPLSASRPSRIFSKPQLLDDPTTEEIKELRVARASRLAKIYSDAPVRELKPIQDEAAILKAKQQQEEERALAAEKAKKEAQAQAKKEEAARKAELARQEQLAAQAAAERAAELERQAELARQEELAKQAEIEKARKLEEERLRQEEQKRLEEEAKAEEERKQLERLEELARQAEEEKEAELARQAEELAELARQEAELAEQAKKAAEAEELARQQAELEELERQEAELAELEAKERELAEAAELAKQEAEVAQQHAEEAEQEAEQAAEEEVPQSEPVEEEAAPEEEQQPEAAPEVELNIETEPEAVDEPAEEPEE